jgi:hypothetical protein
MATDGMETVEPHHSVRRSDRCLCERIKSEGRHNKPVTEKRLAEIEEATIDALRHADIVRQLLANVPIGVVAIKHDTGLPCYIADDADALARPALIEIAAPRSNVVQHRRA